jgi:hypothetical protein
LVDANCFASHVLPVTRQQYFTVAEIYAPSSAN